MKTIDTLVEDIYSLLEEGTLDEDYRRYGEEHAEVLQQRLDARNSEGGGRGLRLSSVGTPCTRKLWYGAHSSNEREPLLPHVRLKFLYGDVTETLVLELARKSGHLVVGEQDEILVDGIVGHRDCVIDGMLVDVKTASEYSFRKFQSGLSSDDDSFGYLTQLGSYLLGSQGDPLVTNKNEAAFLAINKVTGKLCLDRHTFTEEDFDRVRRKIETSKEALAKEDEEPERTFEEVPEGKSGNLKLGVNCSYCDFKAKCWPNLRTFIYGGNRPVFLTRVERVPNVPEVTDGT